MHLPNFGLRSFGPRNALETKRAADVPCEALGLTHALVDLPYAARQALQNLDRTIGETVLETARPKPKGEGKEFKPLQRARCEGLTSWSRGKEP